ncbi:MAG: hypothetical protein HFJ48_01400 [Clostridia bacterium]|nr:hypothetical protein [Clostridia bacterium]
MKNYDIKEKNIELYNIVFATTSEPDYEMNRLILLEDMPDIPHGEYVLVEGYHCSCYGFNETNWDCVQLTKDELKAILKDNNWDLREQLKRFLEEGNY